MNLSLDANIDYSFNPPNATLTITDASTDSQIIIESLWHHDDFEEIESQLEKIASQIREFRMKNFPESENIDE